MVEAPSKKSHKKIIIAVVVVIAIILLGLFVYWMYTLLRTESFDPALSGDRKDKIVQRVQNQNIRPAIANNQEMNSSSGSDSSSVSTANPNRQTYLNQSNVSDAATAATMPPFTLYNFSKQTCPYCKKFEPVWSELVAQIRNIPGLRAEYIDTTKPENEDIVFYFNIEGVPTIILVTPDQIIEYSGNRTLQDLHNFITTHIGAYNTRV